MNHATKKVHEQRNVSCKTQMFVPQLGTTDEVTSEEEEEEEMGEVRTFPHVQDVFSHLTASLSLHMRIYVCILCQQDIDLEHYDMKEEEPVDGKKSEDDGIEKENLAILEKIRKNQRQDHLNVSAHSVR